MKRFLRDEKMAIWMILALAFALRVAGIGFGLPQIYHQDEPVIVNHAMAIGVRGWNPHFFVIPPFSIYFLFGSYAVYFILGKLTGLFSNAASFGTLFLSDASSFYLLGRFFLGVIFGVLAVYWLYRIARRHFSFKTGVYSSLFLAICYLHASQSHYIYADIPLVFFSVVMLGAFLDLCQEPSRRNHFFFALAIGLAVSAKYTAAYFLPVYFLAYLLGEKKENRTQRIASFGMVGTLSVLVFALVAPYTFLDWKNFYSQIHNQSGAEGYLGIFYHFGYSLLNGVGMPLLFLAGIGYLLMLRAYRFKSQLLIALCLLYYGINIFFSQPFTRYMLPLVPLVCLLAGFGWGVVEEVLGPWARRGVLGLIVCASLVPVIYLDVLFLQKDTRDFCQAWVEKYIPAGSVVVRDNAFYAPHLLQSPEEIDRKYADKEAKDPAKKKRLDLMRAIATTKTTYRVYTLAAETDITDEGFLFQKPLVGMSLNKLTEIGAEYLIINYSQNDPRILQFKDSIMGKLELLVSFSPYWSGERKATVDKFSGTAASDSLPDLFSRKRLGPYLEVYRIKPS